MLKEEISFKRKEAVLLTVDFSGPIEGYAMAWLKLTNNAREYGNMIWKIFNDREKGVYVICNPKHVEAVKEFCDGIYTYYNEKKDETCYIGKVISEGKIIVGVPMYEYESTCWGDDEKWEADIDKAVLYWLAVEEE